MNAENFESCCLNRKWHANDSVHFPKAHREADYHNAHNPVAEAEKQLL
jgi:hypothetical protein